MSTRIRTSVFGVALSFLFVASACDGGAGDSRGSGGSGVQSSKRLVTLSDAEVGQLCDWMVAKAGSYGTPGTCDLSRQPPDRAALVYVDQAACIADRADSGDPNCVATVGQLEACVNQLPKCGTQTDLANTPACAAIAGC